MENYHCAIDCRDYDKQGLFKRKFYDQDTSWKKIHISCVSEFWGEIQLKTITLFCKQFCKLISPDFILYLIQSVSQHGHMFSIFQPLSIFHMPVVCFQFLCRKELTLNLEPLRICTQPYLIMRTRSWRWAILRKFFSH